MSSDFLKAVVYKITVDVPMLMLLAWLWFGHPGHNMWFIGVSTTIGTILLYYFDQYWAIKDRWHKALPVSMTWLLLVTGLFAYLSLRN
jgi:hypothetical protein